MSLKLERVGGNQHLKDARSLLHYSFQVSLCEHSRKHGKLSKDRVIVWLVVVCWQCIQRLLLGLSQGCCRCKALLDKGRDWSCMKRRSYEVTVCKEAKKILKEHNNVPLHPYPLGSLET
jgi:hypothetical protein